MTADGADPAAGARQGAGRCRAVLAALVLGVAAGCSGVKTYPDIPEKNLHIRTETKSGSAFSRVRAVLGVHRVDARCQTVYEGTVDLDQPAVSVGIPVDRSSYLVFAFASSGFLASARTSITRETLLDPRPGHRYDIDVSYKDDIYNVVIVEHPLRGGASREIPFRDVGGCSRR